MQCYRSGASFGSSFRFDISEKQVREQGLIIGQTLTCMSIKSFDEVRKNILTADFFYCSTKSENVYSDIDYKAESSNGEEIFLVFGKETKDCRKSCCMIIMAIA